MSCHHKIIINIRMRNQLFGVFLYIHSKKNKQSKPQFSLGLTCIHALSHYPFELIYELSGQSPQRQRAAGFVKLDF